MSQAPGRGIFMYYDIKESGKRIKELRKQKGYTQEQMAEKAGISVKTVSAIETGARGTTIDMIAILAEMLDTTTDYLITGKAVNTTGIDFDIPEDKKEFALKMLKAILENM